MNQKHFIILFVLLILFEKTYGCHPSGSDTSGDDCSPYDFQITDIKWLPNSQLAVTIVNNKASTEPKLMVHALGHYTFSGDKGHNYRFLQHPEFVNTHHCADTRNEVNPYTDIRSYDPAQTPVEGEWVGIWLRVYWGCDFDYAAAVFCCSEQLFINTPYKPSDSEVRNSTLGYENHNHNITRLYPPSISR